MVGVAAKVQDLHGDLAAGLVHRIGHDLVLSGLFFSGQTCAARIRTTVVIGGNTAGDHQGHATASALGIESGHTLEAILGFFQTHVHRTHQDAVLQRGKAQIKRFQKVGKSSHVVS